MVATLRTFNSTARVLNKMCSSSDKDWSALLRHILLYNILLCGSYFPVIVFSLFPVRRVNTFPEVACCLLNEISFGYFTCLHFTRTISVISTGLIFMSIFETVHFINSSIVWHKAIVRGSFVIVYALNFDVWHNYRYYSSIVTNKN